MAKILMVDDDRDFLEACRAVLEPQGYQVILAANVEEAESAVKKENPDLIFLDVMMDMPDDGISLAYKLAKGGLKAPIVMLSGVSQAMGFEYGKCDEVLPCRDFLEKPVKPDDLLSKVKKMLG
jgi:DNA-binding response OmpR family regulator